jgi:tRNA A37 threonylcarbamoyladenosine dehydratase
LTEYGAASNAFPVSKEDERSMALAARARKGDYDDGRLCILELIRHLSLTVQLDLILEQLARNRVFLTDEGLEKLRSSFVIVVGCGGVGSHATAALARSGVSNIRLIDFDQVTLSSLNRHAVATLADVGTSKVHCIRTRLEQITPWTHFDCRNELFSEASAATQLAPMNGQAPDYVIDAIDNIDSKVALLAYCARNSLKVISSMGAGCKSDPTKVFIGDISTSTDDPLSKSTRRRLRLLGVKDGIPVVFSTEKPGTGKAQLLPLAEEEFAKGSVGELGVLPDFRVRILPVLGTMPAIFGLAVANHVILEITGYPHDYLPSKARDKMYDGILGALQGAEERLARSFDFESQGLKVPLTQDDVGYLVEEVYHGRSVISGLSTRLCLCRWNKPIENFVDKRTPGQNNSLLQLKELVLMTKEEAAKHEKEVLKGDKKPGDLYERKVVDAVRTRMEEEEKFERFR